MNELLDALRAHVGEPAMPIEQCPICSKLPATMSRDVEDQDVSDDRPPESDQLEKIASKGTDELFRCPTCRRLYVGQMEYGVGYFDYNATWRRVRAVSHDIFPKHALVQLEGSERWYALDGDNQLTPLDRAALQELIERDPPRVTGDLELAKRYASIVDRIEAPDDQQRDSLDSITWREPLSPEEMRLLADVKAAHRVEPASAVRRGEDVRVRFWVTSQKNLISRDVTVKPDGHYQRDGRLIRYNMPILVETLWMFRSLEAFRTHCGEPTMALEQCPICSKIPEHWESEDEVAPREAADLVDFLETHVKRCPTCLRLYAYSVCSYGNDIYLGNETTYTLDRSSVERIFDSEWGVGRRVPNLRVTWVKHDPSYPDRVLVRIDAKEWGTLDHDNRLVMLPLEQPRDPGDAR